MELEADLCSFTSSLSQSLRLIVFRTLVFFFSTGAVFFLVGVETMEGAGILLDGVDTEGFSPTWSTLLFFLPQLHFGQG